ncbi:hypothetical protein L861_14335 [Litchfieldella anticariensis FP35 = DSM 16096]|uniref:Uncharacterized protein n=1 Tax=Litchfieldella anticariensis (strain DSM 16096 / CECT 5854 / CIP 108499 / LMG 22089 / FP35) TaxID=1121939 RepID=S2KJC8_LITA3|nr:hypothetical protein L861_14335 [Halomonas anticariensis FP35 = DSM 16096]
MRDGKCILIGTWSSSAFEGRHQTEILFPSCSISGARQFARVIVLQQFWDKVLIHIIAADVNAEAVLGEWLLGMGLHDVRP